MESPSKKQDQDILEQRYRGASPVVAGAGESLLQGKGLLFGGMVAGLIAGAAFPTPMKKAMDACRKTVSRWSASENHLLQGFGGFSEWSLNIGKSVVDWFRRINGVETTISNFTKSENARYRFQTAIDSAIVTSTALSTLGFVTGFFTGSKVSNRGKRQFEAAKDEIRTLRETNTQLRNKLIETQFTLDDLKTADAAKHGTLKVAGDDTPHVTASDTVAAPTSHVSTHGAVHHAPAHDLTSDVALG